MQWCHFRNRKGNKMKFLKGFMFDYVVQGDGH